MQLKKYYFFIECIILSHLYSGTIGLMGVNVRPARQNEFPFVVSITRLNNTNAYRENPLHLCTGTLLSRKDLITAEHCLRNIFTEGFKVLVGSHDMTRTSPFYPVFVWTYEHWSIFRQMEIISLRNDIAMIKLMESVPDYITIAPMGNMDNHLLWGLDLTVAGFGKIVNNSFPRTLQTVGVKVMSRDDCENKMFHLEIFIDMDNAHLCSAANPFAVLGEGDSGGPLLFFGTLVGINIGIFPHHGQISNFQQVNFHMGIRYHQRFIADCMHIFTAR